MLSVEQVVVDCRALFRLLIEGQYLNKGKGAHDLHHIFLVVDRCVVFCSLNVGSEVLARVVAKFLTCRLVVLRRWAFYDFMTNRKRLHLNNLLIVLLLLIDYCFVLLLLLLLLEFIRTTLSSDFDFACCEGLLSLFCLLSSISAN